MFHAAMVGWLAIALHENLILSFTVKFAQFDFSVKMIC
uniref:Uncharacterized protein n=1 Tax=Setaria viridis TaxID=4556 RepID=A0A4U6T4G2_SETVI|nr:hypothetical protein SEVIR_9G437050v2 [Setaria viridis]